MNLPELWRSLALDPPRAGVATTSRARLRVEAEDFVVDEILGFAPGGTGPHALLRVRKRNANTEWVAREIARAAGVRPFDVGFAGLKDRRAVTTQWFTVPLGKRTADSWQQFAGEGFEVIEAHAHQRKLPRGALAGNRFTLRLREFTGDRAACEASVAAVARGGAPNYFGPQRFGRGLSNLREGGSGNRAMDLSAARSLIFNAVLAQRVNDGSWRTLLDGEVVNLDGTNSVFVADTTDESLAPRVAALDLHPTGPMWGEGGKQPGGSVAALEASIAAGFPPLLERVAAARAEGARRSLRVVLRDLRCGWDGDTLLLEFELRGGSFATAVLREIVDVGGEDES